MYLHLEKQLVLICCEELSSRDYRILYGSGTQSPQFYVLQVCRRQRQQGQCVPDVLSWSTRHMPCAWKTLTFWPALGRDGDAMFLVSQVQECNRMDAPVDTQIYANTKFPFGPLFL